MNINQRPNSLKEVAIRINQNTQDKSFAISEFIDHFNSLDKVARIASLADEPERISINLEQEEYSVMDAYLAGIAEYLSATNNLPMPHWTNKNIRFLKLPFFANSGLKSLNPMLTIESPTSFRRRMIFTERRPFRRV